MEKRFLLIQDNKVIETAPTIRSLKCLDMREFRGWKVAVGCINEFDQPEIVGIVAEVYPIEITVNTYRISSETDGYARLIGRHYGPWYTVWLRLETLEYNGRFNDLANLPQPVILMPDRKALSAFV